MMNPLAIDHDPQVQSSERQLKPGLEAIDIASDRHPPRLGGDQGFHPGPPTQGYFDRVEAPQAVEQLEQILLEKRPHPCGIPVSARTPGVCESR
jgi:hypothetical protein